MNFYYFYIDLENLDNLMAWNWGHLKVYEIILNSFWVKHESKICCKFFLYLSSTKSVEQLSIPKLGEKKKGGCCYISMIIDLFSSALYCVWKNHGVDEKGVLGFALRWSCIGTAGNFGNNCGSADRIFPL